jgi:hypothetical protein
MAVGGVSESILLSKIHTLLLRRNSDRYPCSPDRLTHPQQLFFSNSTDKTEIGTANRWETSNFQVIATHLDQSNYLPNQKHDGVRLDVH